MGVVRENPDHTARSGQQWVRMGNEEELVPRPPRVQPGCDSLRNIVGLVIELDSRVISFTQCVMAVRAIDSRCDGLSVRARVGPVPLTHRTHARDGTTHRHPEILMVAGGEDAATTVHELRDGPQFRLADLATGGMEPFPGNPASPSVRCCHDHGRSPLSADASSASRELTAQG